MTIEPMDRRESALLALAHAYGVTVHVTRFDSQSQRGAFDPETHRIYIARGLSTAQRASALAHEVAHVRAGHTGHQNPSTERYVDEEAAGLIIRDDDYRSAEILFGPSVPAIAQELDVTPALVEAWQRRRARTYHLPRV